MSINRGLIGGQNSIANQIQSFSMLVQILDQRFSRSQDYMEAMFMLLVLNLLQSIKKFSKSWFGWTDLAMLNWRNLPCRIRWGNGNQLSIIRFWSDAVRGQGQFNKINEDGHGFAIVEFVRLDDLNIKNISFIKVDIEGRIEFLEGAKETIDRERPAIVLEIFNSTKRKGLLNPLGVRMKSVFLMKSYGYKQIARKNKDVLFIRQMFSHWMWFKFWGMLPWCISNIQKHMPDIPIVVADFGLSQKGIKVAVEVQKYHWTWSQNVSLGSWNRKQFSFTIRENLLDRYWLWSSCTLSGDLCYAITEKIALTPDPGQREEEEHIGQLVSLS